MTGEQCALAVVEIVPGTDVMVRLGVAGRELQPVGHDAELPLAGEALVPQLVPATVVAAAVLGDVVRPSVQRCVHGSVREVQKNGCSGLLALRSRIIEIA